jgi:hypothetical protein
MVGAFIGLIRAKRLIFRHVRPPSHFALAANGKCLAQSNKSHTGAKATNKRNGVSHRHPERKGPKHDHEDHHRNPNRWARAQHCAAEKFQLVGKSVHHTRWRTAWIQSKKPRHLEIRTSGTR